MRRAVADPERSLRGIPRAVLDLLPSSLWKLAIRESRVAFLEAVLVFRPSEEVLDFFRAVACFLAGVLARDIFLVFPVAIFLDTLLLALLAAGALSFEAGKFLEDDLSMLLEFSILGRGAVGLTSVFSGGQKWNE